MIAALWPFIMGGVALGLDAYVVAGLLPGIAEALGVSESLAGVGVAAFTGCYAMSGPLMAGRAGRHSQRSLIISLAVFTAANLATAAAHSIVFFLMARALAGAAAGVYSPLSSAVAGVMASERDRGRALALVLAGLAIGTVLGVPAGLTVAEHWGWRAAILLVTASGTVSLIGILLQQRELPTVPASPAAERLRTLLKPANAASMTVTLLTGIASLGLYTYLNPVLRLTALHDRVTLGIWIWGLGGATGALTIGRVIDRTGKPLRLSLGLIAGLSGSIFAMFASHMAPALLIALFVWGFCGWASLAPQQHTLLATNPDDGASAVAANASANYLGSALGALVGSTLIGTCGPNGLITAMGVISIAALVLQCARIRMQIASGTTDNA